LHWFGYRQVEASEKIFAHRIMAGGQDMGMLATPDKARAIYPNAGHQAAA